MEGTGLIGALVSRQVDAIGQFVVGEPLVAAAAEGRPVTVLPYDEYLGDMYGVCLLTRPALADSHPELCARFRDALLAGCRTRWTPAPGRRGPGARRSSR